MKVLGVFLLLYPYTVMTQGPPYDQFACFIQTVITRADRQPGFSEIRIEALYNAMKQGSLFDTFDRIGDRGLVDSFISVILYQTDFLADFGESTVIQAGALFLSQPAQISACYEVDGVFDALVGQIEAQSINMQQCEGFNFCECETTHDILRSIIRQSEFAMRTAVWFVLGGNDRRDTHGCESLLTAATLGIQHPTPLECLRFAPYPYSTLADTCQNLGTPLRGLYYFAYCTLGDPKQLFGEGIEIELAELERINYYTTTTSLTCDGDGRDASPKKNAELPGYVVGILAYFGVTAVGLVTAYFCRQLSDLDVFKSNPRPKDSGLETNRIELVKPIPYSTPSHHSAPQSQFVPTSSNHHQPRQPAHSQLQAYHPSQYPARQVLIEPDPYFSNSASATATSPQSTSYHGQWPSNPIMSSNVDTRDQIRQQSFPR